MVQDHPSTRGNIPVANPPRLSNYPVPREHAETTLAPPRGGYRSDARQNGSNNSKYPGQGPQERTPWAKNPASASRGAQVMKSAPVVGTDDYNRVKSRSTGGMGRINQLTPPAQDPIVIVIGCTGAGKSTLFSSLGATGSRSGSSLHSETHEVTEWTGVVNGIKLTLVDTPGFGDTSHSDTHTLTVIAEWLLKSYNKGHLINGVIYVHRITDNRMSGEAVQSLQVLENLCGYSFMKNIVLCTSFWDVVDPKVGESREEELCSEFWRTLIENKATVMRHDKSIRSAQDIVAQAAHNTIEFRFVFT